MVVRSIRIDPPDHSIVPVIFPPSGVPVGILGKHAISTTIVDNAIRVVQRIDNGRDLVEIVVLCPRRAALGIREGDDIAAGTIAVPVRAYIQQTEGIYCTVDP